MGTYLSSRFITFADLVQTVYNNDVESAREALADLSQKSDVKELLSTPLENDQYSRTLLHIAAWSPDSDVLKVLLEYNPQLEVQDIWGWTPLWAAIYSNKISNARVLMNKGAIFSNDESELSFLLEHSVKMDHLDATVLLFEQGVQMPNQENDQTQPPLINQAVGHDDIGLVKVLLEKGKADPNVYDEFGHYPLHIAVSYNNIGICEVLLEHSAQVNVKDKNGNTPLSWAKKLQFMDIATTLEKAGGIADDDWHGDEEISMVAYDDYNEPDEPIKENEISDEDEEDEIQDDEYVVDDDYGPWNEELSEKEEEVDDSEENEAPERADDINQKDTDVSVELDELNLSGDT